MKIIIIKTFAILFIIIILIILLRKILKKNYYFYNTKETRQFLLKDNDKYIANMSNIDIYARKCKNKTDYLNKIAECSSSFSLKEIKILKKYIKIADNFFYNYNNIINGKELLNIKWIFAITDKSKDNFEYEEGFPHTRENIIFLTKKILASLQDKELNTEIITILIHEKIHIYQRLNKNKMDDIIKKMGFIKIDNDNNKNKLYKRTNPDITDDVYYDIISKKILFFYYNSSTPKHINDINMQNYSLEHPYEKMAYEIANEYAKILYKTN